MMDLSNYQAMSKARAKEVRRNPDYNITNELEKLSKKSFFNRIIQYKRDRLEKRIIKASDRLKSAIYRVSKGYLNHLSAEGLEDCFWNVTRERKELYNLARKHNLTTTPNFSQYIVLADSLLTALRNKLGIKTINLEDPWAFGFSGG